jgi:23S rRNA (cytosine1962-C5)-methyltransferase
MEKLQIDVIIIFMNQPKILVCKSSKNYELLDSGDGEKLERFGSIVLSRPDPQALWQKNLEESDWKNADAVFSRVEEGASWKFKNETPKSWDIDFSNLKFRIKPTAFKHTGIFPEQSENWNWTREILKDNKDAEILNLFGYTGGASLACAQAGAKVVHVDGSKSAITWARENAEISGLADKPIRWIIEDARVFVGREIKRDRKYDGIIMDPPAFGHGANKELWKIEEDFLPLVENAFKLLKDKPSFFLINGYSAGYSAIAYRNVLNTLVEKYGGSVEIGELTIEEKTNNKGESRLLPCGIFARWKA